MAKALGLVLGCGDNWQSVVKENKAGLSFERGECAQRGQKLMFLCCLGRLRGEVRVCATGVLKIIKQACPLRGGLCALRARGLFFILVWAACAAGGVGMHGEH